MNIFRGEIISKKITFSLVEGVERSAFAWLGKRRHRLIFFILVIVLLIAFSHAPYINLFFDTYLVILVSASLLPFILNIDAKPFLITALVLFVPTSFFWFAEQDRAEIMGSYIFIILLSGIFRDFFSSQRYNKKV